MFIKPFSFKRFLVYLVSILGAAAIIGLNKIFIPGTLNNILVILTIYMFAIGIYHIFALFGVIKKIDEQEWNVVRNEIRETLDKSNDIRMLRYKVAMNSSNKTKNIEDSEAKMILENLETAKETWKNKRYKDMTNYERFYAVENKLYIWGKVVTLYTVIINFIMGFVVLNISILSIYFLLLTGLFILILGSMIFIHFFILNKKRSYLRKQIYPKNILNTFDKLMSDI